LDVLPLLTRESHTSHGVYASCAVLQALSRAQACGDDAGSVIDAAPLAGSVTVAVSGRTWGLDKGLKPGATLGGILACGGHVEATQLILYPHELVKAQGGALRSHAELTAFTTGQGFAPLALATGRTLVRNMANVVKELQTGSSSMVSARPLHAEVSAVIVGSDDQDPLSVLSRAVRPADTAVFAGENDGPQCAQVVLFVHRS
jgi:hypothetical protein